MKIKKILFILVAVSQLIFYVEAFAKQDESAASFPTIARSFDDKYTIDNSYNENYNPDSASGPAFKYRLILTNTGDGYKTNVLYEYSRSVDIAWAPQSDGLFVNDHAGSDNANSIIFIIGEQIKKISIYDELKRLMPDNKTIFKQANAPEHFNDHVYITCDKWLDGSKVLIKVEGYGEVNPKGFELWYEYDVSKGTITSYKK